MSASQGREISATFSVAVLAVSSLYSQVFVPFPDPGELIRRRYGLVMPRLYLGVGAET